MAAQAPAQVSPSQDRLSPWWRRSVFAVMVVGFSVLIFLTIKVHHEAPPIPDEVVDVHGTRLFGKEDIQDGQEVFLKYGLMDNGSIWGHGGYLGPDFSAQYLHDLASDVAETLAQQRFGRPISELTQEERVTVEALARSELKQNRFDPDTGTLTFIAGQAYSYHRQINWWADYFSEPIGNGGLPAQFLTQGKELEDLTAFFAWTAWASVTNRSGETQSYTNNFPYDPLSGNLPTGSALLWSAISLIALLVGIALVLLAFGKFDYLGWKSSSAQVTTRLLPGNPTPTYFKVSFWGLNIGLLMTFVFSLFPGGVLQLMDVLENGYWHARSLAYTGQATARLIEWLRTPGDLVFIFVGVLPALIAVTLSYFNVRADSKTLGVSPAWEGA